MTDRLISKLGKNAIGGEQYLTRSINHIKLELHNKLLHLKPGDTVTDVNGEGELYIAHGCRDCGKVFLNKTLIPMGAICQACNDRINQERKSSRKKTRRTTVTKAVIIEGRMFAEEVKDLEELEEKTDDDPFWR